MSNEAMKLALEALKENHYYMIDAGLPNQSMLNKTLMAYKALEEALAKQKQDDNYYYGNPDKYCRGDERYYANE
jgi:hypothetical protein